MTFFKPFLFLSEKTSSEKEAVMLAEISIMRYPSMLSPSPNSNKIV